jgi:hypothetical protein
MGTSQFPIDIQGGKEMGWGSAVRKITALGHGSLLRYCFITR